MTEQSELEALLQAAYYDPSGGILKPAYDQIFTYFRAEKAAAAEERRRFLVGAYAAIHGEDPPADMSSLMMLGSISTMHSKKLFEASERKALP